MKKLFALSFLFCFIFSSFASTSFQGVKIEKHKIEKVLFEAVAVSISEVTTSKNGDHSSIVFVQQRHSDFTKDIGFANKDNQSFNYKRYWCRNYKSYTFKSIYICVKKDYPTEPEDEVPV